MYYGIFYPFFACIGFEFIAMLIIIFTWKENDMAKLVRKERYINYNEVLKSLLRSMKKILQQKSIISSATKEKPRRKLFGGI